MGSRSEHLRPALLALACTTWLACGRVSYVARDEGPAERDAGATIDAQRDASTAIDAATAIDAPGDAPALDASAPPIDAGSDDASAAPIDARVDDASRAPDAGDCIGTVRWFSGTGSESLHSVAITDDGAMVLSGQFSVSGLVPGLTSGGFVARIDGDSVVWQRSGSFYQATADGNDVLVLRGDAAMRISSDGTSERSLGTHGAIFGGAIAPRGAGAVVAVSTSGAFSWSGTSITAGAGAADITVVVLDASGAVLASASGGDTDNDVVYDVNGTGDRYYVAGASNSATFCIAPAGCTPSDADFVLTLEGSPPRPATFLTAIAGASWTVALDPASNVYAAGNNVVASLTPAGATRWTQRGLLYPHVAYDDTTDRVVIAARLNLPVTFAGVALAPLGVGDSFVVLWLDPATGAVLRHQIFGDGGIDASDIAVTSSGSVIVVGSTDAPFAVCGETPPASGGGFDAFVLTLLP